ncbi:MAG: class I SAM-dependent methyltransferase [Peptostreptococcaceae bacterium]|nr:class I SAM-dependent methyltransferase [Peptostreptococcaceae bacterium]
MLDNKGFDLWADDYDKSVGLSDEDNTFPFAGYKEVLGKIFADVMCKKNARVLDIGFGTGTLTSKLYENGCMIWGVDFSERMIEIAHEKMPQAHLVSGDFTKEIPKDFLQKKFDFIIATYALHHLTDEEKPDFLKSLLPLLDSGGKILIGDVAFDTREELLACQEENASEWDEEEFYFVSDEIKAIFPQKCRFEKISFCAGIFYIG